MTDLEEKLAKLAPLDRKAVEAFLEDYIWGCKQAPSSSGCWNEPVPTDDELRQDGLKFVLGPKLHLYIAKYKKRLSENEVFHPVGGSIDRFSR